MTRSALSIEAVGRRANNVLLPHSIQAWDNDYWSNKVIEEQLDQRQISPSKLEQYCMGCWLGLITDRYLPQHLNSHQRHIPRGTLNSSARVALEPMARWIRWWVLPMYRSSSNISVVIPKNNLSLLNMPPKDLYGQMHDTMVWLVWLATHRLIRNENFRIWGRRSEDYRKVFNSEREGPMALVNVWIIWSDPMIYTAPLW